MLGNKLIHNNAVVIGILIMLLFNSIGTIVVASALTHSAKNFTSQDVELVCTGATFKWMSVSHYQQTGEILFVDAPADAPSGFEHIQCANTYITDTSNEYCLLKAELNVSLVNNSNQTIDYLNAEYSARKHQRYSSRAPPAQA